MILPLVLADSPADSDRIGVLPNVTWSESSRERGKIDLTIEQVQRSQPRVFDYEILYRETVRLDFLGVPEGLEEGKDRGFRVLFKQETTKE